ncbi:MAG: PDZ domain-containing protein [Actinobacteria bacterium]|nr:MAG: PDZ domain-containing protein [Actinomycetota bacterium]
MDDADRTTWVLPVADEPAPEDTLPGAPEDARPPTSEDPIPPAPPAPPPPAPSGGGGWRRPAALVTAAVVAGAAAGGIVGRATSHTNTRAAPVVAQGPGTGSIRQPADIQQVLSAIEPAVVAVRTQAFRRGPFFPTQGAGSGVILTADGEVLTNAHVVDGATDIEVTLIGERTARAADVVGVDTTADVALIKIRNASGLPTVKLGSSADLRVGDSVVAIGNALDLGATPTVTEGIVSALNRSIDAPDESLAGLIQTDAAINPGNSGGPLVDAKGEVVGMNTAIAGDAQNIGFALAIDRIKPVVDKLRAHPGQSASGSTTPNSGGAFLGVNVADDPNGGADVARIVSGSPADKAGLRAGDVVTAIDGTKVTGADDLVAAVQRHRPGDTVSITFTRGSNTQTVKVKLASPQA